MLEQAFLETLMDKAWPAVERKDTGEWVLRASSGVTQRANSVWPRSLPGAAGTAGLGGTEDIARSVSSASAWYRQRRLPLIFQIFDDSRSAGLNAVLDGQRFTRQSETLIMVRGMDALENLSAGPKGVEVSDTPTDEWLRLWWSVDGRGGEVELEVARTILTGCKSLYALVRDDDGVPAAVGRLALVDGWGGLYTMATSVTHRRRGYATMVLSALLEQGAARNLQGFWLLVTASNRGAQALYSRAGFVEQGSYLYRQAPLRRAPGGC
ncbi:putative N-acetyltransferase YobR [Arthrobacter sp. StoSoilA2]|uniref:GNAT family N-acetyltransferase n=1 Tax=Arthrobacter sp. StoSoilA2 TaxID=2830990 RepID=UPI001CC3DCB2|nr:GNAT family N-acetyltransferase [Arthrobacter sp. StoSoilA2]BCW36502.1 putative N-acetyltransferase YobR [Arthrobacter sp. StoSoilA2]